MFSFEMLNLNLLLRKILGNFLLVLRPDSKYIYANGKMPIFLCQWVAYSPPPNSVH